MTTPIISTIKSTLSKLSIDELYKFKEKIDTIQSQIQYPSGIVSLDMFKDVKPKDLENMVDTNIMVGNTVYWPIRMILLNALTKGELNFNDLEEPNLKKIMASEEFKKSLLQAIVDKRISSTGNEVSLLLDIQEIIKTPIPKEDTGAIYKSLLQKYESVMTTNQDLLDPTKKKRVMDVVFRNFGNILRQISQAVQAQISIKSRGGCACGAQEIVNRMSRMDKGKLEIVKKQLGGNKLKRVLDKCGCRSKEVAKLKAKINL